MRSRRGEAGQRSELEDRSAHPAGRAVDEHRLPALHPRHAVKQLVSGHVGKNEAHDLRRVEVLRHLDRVGLRHADTLRVGAPHRQHGDTISHSRLEQPGPISSTTPTSS
jgi:hypothetical protein